MSVFVDTSALYALLDADDSNHSDAEAQWSRLLSTGELLVSTNYILVEASALSQRRLGIEAAQALHHEIAPLLVIEWINASQHNAAMGELIAAGQRQVSLVDWTSFATMRRMQINSAFAFDQDFRTQGFETVPAGTGQQHS